jgi:serine/threonine protein kinase
LGRLESRQADGLYNLGLYFEFGQDDYRLAASCYRSAADRGHPGGQHCFGLCLERGLGVPQNPPLAAKYYELSDRQGHSPGRAKCAFARLACVSMDPEPIRVKTDACRFSQMITASCLDQWQSPHYEHFHLAPPFRESDASIRPGRTSRITFARGLRCRRKIAVKTLYVVEIDKAQFLRQVKMVATWNHPCLSHVLSWRDIPKSDSVEIHTQWRERRSLELLLTDRMSFDATRKGIVICGIVLGMRFIDSQGLVYRNLKPSNILIDCCGDPLIDDVLSSFLEVDRSVWVTDPHNSNYAAPEVLAGDPHASSSAVFSFGLLLYEILVGPVVFESESGYMPFIRQIMDRVTQIPAECGLLIQDLIRECWSIEPKSRPTFNDIFSKFERVGFAIPAGADSAAVSAYVNGVLGEEKKNRPSPSDLC